MRILLFALLFAVSSMPGQWNQVKAAEPLLHYVAREPKVKTAKTPVIFLLHGIGSNENDLFSFADQLPGKFLVISARAPYPYGQNGNAWYQADFSTDPPIIDKAQAEESRNTIVRFIAQMKDKYHFDDKQVFLVGFSQGAIMSYSVGLTRPDVVKGIAILSGRFPDPGTVASKEKLEHLNVFISHGTNDHVITIQHARDAKSHLEKLGIRPAYKEYTARHEINKDMLADLISWLGK